MVITFANLYKEFNRVNLPPKHLRFFFHPGNSTEVLFSSTVHCFPLPLYRMSVKKLEALRYCKISSISTKYHLCTISSNLDCKNALQDWHRVGMKGRFHSQGKTHI
jgi:hypothetical protein